MYVQYVYIYAEVGIVTLKINFVVQSYVNEKNNFRYLPHRYFLAMKTEVTVNPFVIITVISFKV